MKTNTQLRRQYTFMKLNNATTKAGDKFVACTVSGQVLFPTQLTQVDGKSVISFILPIQNRSRTIERFCGAQPSTDDLGTTWADVTLWGKRAENFARYVERHPRSAITVVGAMRIEPVKNKEGVSFNRVKITMSDFDHKTDIPTEHSTDKDPANDAQTVPTDNGCDAGVSAVETEVGQLVAEAEEQSIPLDAA